MTIVELLIKRLRSVVAAIPVALGRELARSDGSSLWRALSDRKRLRYSSALFLFDQRRVHQLSVPPKAE
jgi:hypothetical protein